MLVYMLASCDIILHDVYVMAKCVFHLDLCSCTASWASTDIWSLPRIHHICKSKFSSLSPLLFILHYTNTTLPFTIQEASHILPCKFDSVSEEKAEMARGLIERLKGIIQRLPYQNYITLARLLFHLNRYVVCLCSLLPYISENFCWIKISATFF